MRFRPTPGLPLAGLAFVLASCAGSAVNGSPAPPHPGSATRFPLPHGGSLAAVASGIPVGPRLAPLVAVLRPGRARFAFRLDDGARHQIAGAAVALYISGGMRGGARGPYFARFSPLRAARRRPTAKRVRARRNGAVWIYRARLRFPRPGTYAVLALMRLDGRLVATPAVAVTVITATQR